ncbi:hypothetical protein [Rubrivirga sp.]|uniref:hypothetical protein n=1 Tax=Rubrivirga sp. TaxID=1885344 RepID=UPI003B515F91
MLRAALLAAVLPLTAAGCATAQSPTETPADPSEAPADAGRTPDAGEPLRLEVGETARRDGHTVRFVEVVEDSRCPEGVDCIRAGRAQIRVEVDGEPFVLTVPHAMMRDDETSMVEWGEIQVVVTGLDPYPGSAEAEADAPVEAVLVTRPSTA